jgi:hypothetical protein
MAGFDVIIGNPPYVELNALSEYKTRRVRSSNDMPREFRSPRLRPRPPKRISSPTRYGFLMLSDSTSKSDDHRPLADDIVAKVRLWCVALVSRPHKSFPGHMKLVSSETLGTPTSPWSGTPKTNPIRWDVASTRKTHALAIDLH